MDEVEKELQRQRDDKGKQKDDMHIDYSKYFLDKDEDFLSSDVCGFSETDLDTTVKVLNLLCDGHGKKALMGHPRFSALRKALKNLMGIDKDKFRKELKRGEQGKLMTRKLAADLCCEMRVKKLGEREIVQR